LLIKTKQELLILESDKIAARERITEIEAEIIALGPEFYEAFNQTSETWHDNAPFEVVRDHQTLLAAERYTLREILSSSAISIPKQKKGAVGIGSTVTLTDKKTNKSITYFVAGDWTPNAGLNTGLKIIVSRKSPIAEAFFGKKVGCEIKFRDRIFNLDKIE